MESANFLLATALARAPLSASYAEWCRGSVSKMLIQHLKEMEADGIVAGGFKESAHVEYGLNPPSASRSGIALHPLCDGVRCNRTRIQACKELWRRSRARKWLLSGTPFSS